MSAKITPSADHGAGLKRLVFRTYTLCMFVMVFCVNVPAPLFELFRQSNGLRPGELSGLYAVYAGVVIVGLPFFGRGSDRFGRRSLVGLGLGLVAVGSLALAVVGSFIALLGGRLLQGLGVAAMSAPAASALAELTDRRGQASVASTVAVALAVGGASAPLFSGIVAEAMPTFPTVSLLGCAAMAVVCLLGIAVLPDPWRMRLAHSDHSVLEPATARAAQRGAAGDRPAELALRMEFWQACATVIICFGAQTTFFTTSGPIFATLLASHVLLTAGCAMCALMVASGLGGMLARRLSGTVAIARSMVFIVPGVCGFFGLNSLVPPLVLAPAIAAIGLGHGLGYAGAVRLINETAQSGHRAGYMSKFYVAVYIGGGLPVLIMGVVSSFAGQKAASAFFTLLMVAAAMGLLGSLHLSGRRGIGLHPNST